MKRMLVLVACALACGCSMDDGAAVSAPDAQAVAMQAGPRTELRQTIDVVWLKPMGITDEHVEWTVTSGTFVSTQPIEVVMADPTGEVCVGLSQPIFAPYSPEPVEHIPVSAVYAYRVHETWTVELPE